MNRFHKFALLAALAALAAGCAQPSRRATATHAASKP